MPDKLSQIIEDLIYARDHRLLEHQVGRAMIRNASLLGDEMAYDYIHRHVHRHRVRQALTGPFPDPKLHKGDFVIGLDRQDRPIRCPSQYFNEPSLTVGSTGCGKTTKSHLTVLQMATKVKGLWLFEFRKRDMSILRPHLRQIGVDLIVVPGRKLRLNPLQVPS